MLELADVGDVLRLARLVELVQWRELLGQARLYLGRARVVLAEVGADRLEAVERATLGVRRAWNVCGRAVEVAGVGEDGGFGEVLLEA